MHRRHCGGGRLPGNAGKTGNKMKMTHAAAFPHAFIFKFYIPAYLFFSSQSWSATVTTLTRRRPAKRKTSWCGQIHGKFNLHLGNSVKMFLRFTPRCSPNTPMRLRDSSAGRWRRGCRGPTWGDSSEVYKNTISHVLHGKS